MAGSTPGGIGLLKTASGPQVNHHVIQGEQRVSDNPNEVLSTLLGSCVSACLHDAVAGIGGMNHFLLPGDAEGGSGGAAERFGVHAMELLVNAMLARGAVRSRLEAKLFGGARTLRGVTDVGSLNGAFAVSFLKRERIRIASECLGGPQGRRIQFWPVTGRARRSFMSVTERAPPPPPPAEQRRYGAVLDRCRRPERSAGLNETGFDTTEHGAAQTWAGFFASCSGCPTSPTLGRRRCARRLPAVPPGPELVQGSARVHIDPARPAMSTMRAIASLAPGHVSRAESDATTLVVRVGHEIASLARAVGGLQQSLGPALAAAAMGEPSLMLEAQKLDLIEQTLHGLSSFLAALGRCRIGSEPIDLRDYAATLSLAGLAGRLAGQDVEGEDEDLDLF